MYTDFIAGLCELLGLVLVGQRIKFGFLSNFIGCLLWVYVAVTYNIYGLLLVVIPALFINTYNFYYWTTNDNKKIRTIKQQRIK